MLTASSVTTSLVPLLVSPSTSSPSRTAHLPCVTVTRQSRSALVSMRSSPPLLALSTARSSGQTLLYACPSSRARRPRNELHKQRHAYESMQSRAEDDSQKLGKYPSFVEDALVREYEQFSKAGELAYVRSRCTNARRAFDRRIYKPVDVTLMHCCPEALPERFDAGFDVCACLAFGPASFLPPNKPSRILQLLLLITNPLCPLSYHIYLTHELPSLLVRKHRNGFFTSQRTFWQRQRCQRQDGGAP